VTTRTRRLLFLSVLVALLTLPAETMLVRAIQTPSETDAVQSWAGSLDQASLQTAASQIQLYSFEYRRAIMGALTVKDRSDVWRRHLAAYLQAHPQLDAAAVDAIKSAWAMAGPEYFDGPTPEARESLHAVASQIEALLGRDQAEYLLYYLGPKDGTFASFEPMSMRITNALRNMFTLKAFHGTCDCAMYWGCSDWRYQCVNWLSCTQDSGWPQCGWLWEDPCDGACAI
jgi:hypothetical protein